MKKLLLIVLLLLSGSPILAEETSVLDKEVATAIDYLSKFDQETRQYIRFFSMYNIPEEDLQLNPPWEEKEYILPRREATRQCLNFVIHSLSSEDLFKLADYVPGSKTLLWIDLRDYGWTPVAFEQVSLKDPYFLNLD